MYIPWSHPDGYWSANVDRPEPDSDDRNIEALVAQRLSIDWTTRRQQITVSVQNRVAILAGLVHHEEARRVAAELAWDVPGVLDVCNMLRISDRRRGRR